MQIPSGSEAQRRLLRSLMNVRMPGAIDADFLKIQDEYLVQVNFEKGIVDLEDIAEIQRDTYVWRGDITRLAVSAIVNAANSGMLVLTRHTMPLICFCKWIRQEEIARSQHIWFHAALSAEARWT